MSNIRFKLSDLRSFSFVEWPRAIVHFDGDAFFAGCEQALNPKYKGKPVVTGYERGIATSVSYEAKARGAKRGMLISEIKSFVPECIVVPSNYTLYCLISRRMFDIVRSFTPQIEEYSIDEGFADITGLQIKMDSSYESIAKKIKEKIEYSLGISVSVGVSITKTLAKCASNFQKPGGITVVSGIKSHLFLSRIKVGDVWGIGPATSAYLNKLGIITAYDFASKSDAFIKKHFSKTCWEIWSELRGNFIYPVNTGTKEIYKSISKTKTFPPSFDKAFVKAQLLHNLECACEKAFRLGFAAKEVIIFLKKNDFSAHGIKIKLLRPCSNFFELAPIVSKKYEELYVCGACYKTTGIILAELVSKETKQYSLFEDAVKIKRKEKLFNAFLNIKKKYKKGSIFLASQKVYYKTKTRCINRPKYLLTEIQCF